VRSKKTKTLDTFPIFFEDVKDRKAMQYARANRKEVKKVSKKPDRRGKRSKHQTIIQKIKKAIFV